MTAEAKKATRPYLAAARRREHLLEAACRLVRTGGWRALSMQGVAVAAGVSRQLVYEHFDTVEDLSLATLVHLFERSYASTVAIVAAGDSLAHTIRATFAQCLDLPAEERQALRSLAEMESGRRGLLRARRRLRTRIAGLWVPYLQRYTGVSDAEANALAWMIINAAWSLSDRVADGTVGRAAAGELLSRFVEGVLSSFQRKGNIR